MIDPNLGLVMAVKRSQIKPGCTVPGTVETGVCANCGCALLLAPSSLKLIADGKAQAACVECCMRHTQGHTVVPLMTGEAVEEVREFIRQDVEKN